MLSSEIDMIHPASAFVFLLLQCFGLCVGRLYLRRFRFVCFGYLLYGL